MKKVQVAKYSTYKESGVEWLGEIPMHWQVQRGKWLFVKQERPIRPDDDIVTCFRDGQVTLRINRKTDGFTNALKEHGYQGIRKGDLVIHAMDAFAGAIGVSDSDGKSTPVYAACTPREKGQVDPYYYAYFLRSLAKNGFIESLAKGIRERSTDFRYSDFGELLLSVPPIEEQTAIAAFLDRKTAQIDKAIAQKEKLIELLQERRQILIHKAVTRGLNPDVRMKDSGVEWIGEIPEHWEVKSIGYLLKYLSYGFTNPMKTTDDGPYMLTANDIQDGFIDYKNARRTNETEFRNLLTNKSRPLINDVLLTKDGTLGRVAICNIENVCINQSVALLRADDKLVAPSFLKELLRAYLYQKQMVLDAGGTTIKHIYISRLAKMKIAYPANLTEQEQLVSIINFTEQKISKGLQDIRNSIEKLLEFKAVLTNAAVTGKLKVN